MEENIIDNEKSKDGFSLSKNTLIVIDNFTNLMTIDKANTKKIRVATDLLSVKINGLVGVFDATDENNSGFEEFVVEDSKKFLELIKKIGLKDAQFKEPFIFLKNGDTKIKYHTSPCEGIKPIDVKFLTKFDNGEDLIEPFDVDLNELSSFFSNSVSIMKFKDVKLETKNNILKIIAYDSTGIDDGFYEESLNIKTDKKISFNLSMELLNGVVKGNYFAQIKNGGSATILKLTSKDIQGLSYYISEM